MKWLEHLPSSNFKVIIWRLVPFGKYNQSSVELDIIFSYSSILTWIEYFAEFSQQQVLLGAKFEEQ